ncbi:glycosyltransferase [Mumia sp. zg.B53]|uniref:glycosyltransferase n=1 Tax=Mumia sp. zg.B53 TaxID=2855449 RepID=UPI001C6DEB9A|nr:glycosyltransferase [Mumia sp. zg.B53]MBW9214099.1 glycosyltransferase [Mumia sp. zg.B53]
MPSGLSSRVRRAAGRGRRRARDWRESQARPSTDAAALLASGLFDPWYYSLQVHQRLGAARAAEHFLRAGAHDGMLANPLTDFFATGLPPARVVSDLLDGTARTYPVRDFFDDLLDAPAAAHHPGGPVGLYLQHAHEGAPVPALGPRSWPRFREQRTRQSRALRLVLDSGLFDRDHYERQTGDTFLSDRQAVWHYLEVGELQRLAPNPLFEPEWYRRCADVRVVGSFAHFLRNGQAAGSAGPHFDAATYLARSPEAADHPSGPLGHFLAVARGDTPTVPGPDDGVEPTTWSRLSTVVRKGAEEFGAQRRLTAPPPTRWGRWHLTTATPAEGRGDVSVAILTDARAWCNDSRVNLQSVLDQRHRRWMLRIAIEADGSAPPELRSAAADDPRIVLVPTSGETWVQRARELVSTVEEPWVSRWQPQEQWSPYALSGLLSAVSPGTGAYAAAVDTAGADPVWTCELPDRESMLWQPFRSLSATLLPTEVLRETAPRDEALDAYEWDVLLQLEAPLTYVPFVAVRGEDLGALPLPAGLTRSDEHVVRARRILDWPALVAGLGDRVPGRVSALVPTFEDWRFTRHAVALATRADADIEAVVVDNGSRRDVTSVLTATFAGDDHVKILRAPCNTNFATGSNLAFAGSTGEHVVFLNNDTEPREGWLPPLLAALGDPDVIGAQPLLLYPDDSIQTAGTVFYGAYAAPGHLLVSHPASDFPSAADLGFTAITAACMALRAAAVAEAEGFDPAFVNGFEDVDFCLSLVESHGGRFVVVPESRVAHHESKSPGRFARSESNRLRFLERWGRRLPEPQTDLWRAAGFEVVSLRVPGGLPKSHRRTSVVPHVVRPPVLVDSGPAHGLPRLRWALKIAAPGGPEGDATSDAVLADALARALRSWGQEVVIDRRGAHERPLSDYLDDVTLTLRGEAPTAPVLGATNLLWVVSHADEVDPHELTIGFDRVYAEDPAWAEAMEAQSGCKIRTLDTAEASLAAEARTLLTDVLDARGVDHDLG